MRHYYILTLHPDFVSVWHWLNDNNISRELHLNRTRFWVPEGPVLTDFLLRFADSCEPVDPQLDLFTGF